jgi:Fe-S-cluster containining protein
MKLPFSYPPDCQSCGACCAGGPKWVEVTEADAERLLDHTLLDGGDIESFSMKTDEDRRCVALAGCIGHDVACTVYERRPEVCREVERGSETCIFMLGMHGIKPEGW